MKFKHLNVPTHWQNYWSRYPEGYTILEALISWVSQVDDMTDNVNKWNEYLDAFVEHFDEQLQDEVAQTLKDWQESGFLNVVIAEGLQWQLDDYIATNDEQVAQNVARLADNAISPDDFEGSDFEKVQQAIDYAIENKKGIRLSRMFDVTNELPLMINKEDPEDRWGLFFYGVGGGLLKTNIGYMFSSGASYVGDIFYNAVKFESVEGAGTKIFDADKLIRVELTSCTIRYVDTVISADAKYIQSYRFIGGSIVGGNGDAIDCISAFDLVATSLLVEHRDNFFKQRKDTNAQYKGLYQVSFRDCCVEGLRGLAYDFHTTDGVVIDGGYMEENTGGHFYMPDDSNLSNLTISNIRVQQKKGVPNSSVAINWGGTLKNVKTSNIRGGISIPNHDTTRVKAGKVLCENDSSPNNPNIDPNNVLVYHTTDIVFERLLPTYTHESKFFNLKRLYKSSSGVCAVEATTPITVNFSEAIKKDDIVSISLAVPNSPTANVSVLNYRTSNQNLIVNVRNNSTYEHNVVLDIVILKFPYSTY